MKKAKGQGQGQGQKGRSERSFVRLERQGEGFALGLDLSALPVPESSLEVDHWWAYHRDGAISLVFDQVLATGAVKFRLEARLSYEAFLGFVNTMNIEPFKTAFEGYVSKKRFPGPSTPNPTPDSKIVDHQIVRANAIRISHVGSEAEASLYSISVGKVSNAAKDPGALVPVVPLVRVNGTTRAMEHFVNDCRALAPEITKFFFEAQ